MGAIFEPYPGLVNVESLTDEQLTADFANAVCIDYKHYVGELAVYTLRVEGVWQVVPRTLVQGRDYEYSKQVCIACIITGVNQIVTIDLGDKGLVVFEFTQVDPYKAFVEALGLNRVMSEEDAAMAERFANVAPPGVG